MNLVEKFKGLIEKETPKIIERYKSYPKFDIKVIDWCIRINPEGSGEIVAEYFICGDTEVPFYVEFSSMEELEKALGVVQ